MSLTDRFILRADSFLRTTTGTVGPRNRPSPADTIPEPELTDRERAHSARLMRVNHCGEVCAQALYLGQALTARKTRTAGMMQQAAMEETDHLYWCESRIRELGSHVSYTNPFWYATSFIAGALTGLMGDRINLGFIAATEEEVCKHLDNHLEKLPPDDGKSRAVLASMREDEKHHAENALRHGGTRYPGPVRKLMRMVSSLMTRSAYWV